MCNTNAADKAARAQTPQSDRIGDKWCSPVVSCCGPGVGVCSGTTVKTETEEGNRSKKKEVRKTAMCSSCPMRARYDKNPKSLMGRFWRWHINFCPGWKFYMKGLSEEERDEVIKKYNLK